MFASSLSFTKVYRTMVKKIRADTKERWRRGMSKEKKY